MAGMEAMKHTLIIGGTGMLSGASRWLADHSERLSVLSRRPDKFCGSLDMPPEKILSLPSDYYRQADVDDAFQTLKDTGVPIDLVLAWIHSGAVDVLAKLAELFDPVGARVLQVHGSAYADPANTKPGEDGGRFGAKVKFRPIVLGFVVGDTRSRWLTHDEISDGVIAAIKHFDTEQYIVGTVRPWSARP